MKIGVASTPPKALTGELTPPGKKLQASAKALVDFRQLVSAPMYIGAGLMFFSLILHIVFRIAYIVNRGF